MTKLFPAVAATAILGLATAAMAQTSTSPSTAPAKPGASSPSATTRGDAKVMSEADVRQHLQKQGYSNVSDVKRKGDGYEASAMKDGKKVAVAIDSTGKVTAR